MIPKHMNSNQLRFKEQRNINLKKRNDYKLINKTLYLFPVRYYASYD